MLLIFNGSGPFLHHDCLTFAHSLFAGLATPCLEQVPFLSTFFVPTLVSHIHSSEYWHFSDCLPLHQTHKRENLAHTLHIFLQILGEKAEETSATYDLITKFLDLHEKNPGVLMGSPIVIPDASREGPLLTHNASSYWYCNREIDRYVAMLRCYKKMIDCVKDNFEIHVIGQQDHGKSSLLEGMFSLNLNSGALHHTSKNSLVKTISLSSPTSPHVVNVDFWDTPGYTDLCARVRRLAREMQKSTTVMCVIISVASSVNPNAYHLDLMRKLTKHTPPKFILIVLTKADKMVLNGNLWDYVCVEFLEGIKERFHNVLGIPKENICMSTIKRKHKDPIDHYFKHLIKLGVCDGQGTLQWILSWLEKRMMIPYGSAIKYVQQMEQNDKNKKQKEEKSAPSPQPLLIKLDENDRIDSYVRNDDVCLSGEEGYEVDGKMMINEEENRSEEEYVDEGEDEGGLLEMCLSDLKKKIAEEIVEELIEMSMNTKEIRKSKQETMREKSVNDLMEVIEKEESNRRERNEERNEEESGLKEEGKEDEEIVV